LTADDFKQSQPTVREQLNDLLRPSDFEQAKTSRDPIPMRGLMAGNLLTADSVRLPWHSLQPADVEGDVQRVWGDGGGDALVPVHLVSDERTGTADPPKSLPAGDC
jgi:hypothetical protein